MSHEQERPRIELNQGLALQSGQVWETLYPDIPYMIITNIDTSFAYGCKILGNFDPTDIDNIHIHLGGGTIPREELVQSTVTLTFDQFIQGLYNVYPKKSIEYYQIIK